MLPGSDMPREAARLSQAGSSCELKLGRRSRETGHLALSAILEPCYIFLFNLLKRGGILPKYGEKRGDYSSFLGFL